MVDIWSTIHTERMALADQLADVDDEAWDTASLCEAWTVRDVVAHMTATAKISPLSFLPKLIGSGFSLGRMQAKDVARERGTSAADTLARFRSIVSSSKHPPGPSDTWLGEVIVHAEDVRRPLGLAHAYPLDAAAQVADSYAKSNLIIGGKRRMAGLNLTATDTSWTRGEGPEVAGPMMSLLLAVTGRRSGLDDLTGDGVSILAGRC